MNFTAKDAWYAEKGRLAGQLLYNPCAHYFVTLAEQVFTELQAQAVASHQEDSKRFERIWQLHSPEPGQHPDFCGACHQEMPCPTRKAFDDA